MNDIAILSDIHGNYPALQSVLNDIDRRGVRTIYCLGDLVGYYCMINEVVETIRERGIKTVMGNHDAALVKNGGKISSSKTATSILQRQLNYITAPNFKYLDTLPDAMSFVSNNLNCYGVHGGLKNNIEEYINHIDDRYFIENGFDKDVLITGHTHVPVIKKFSSFTYLNPGSVGQPRDSDKRASYLLFSESGEIEVVRIDYAIDEIAEKMKAMNFDSYIYEGLYHGAKIGN